MKESEIYEKLKTELQSVEFSALQPHVQREALLVCDGSLDLLQLGVDLAMDRVETIKSLMQSGKIKKLSEGESQKISPDQKFLFLILQPFVIVQELH